MKKELLLKTIGIIFITVIIAACTPADKILKRDLSEFAGFWANNSHQRLELKSNGDIVVSDYGWLVTQDGIRKFYNDSYWKNSDAVLLVTIENMTKAIGMSIAQKASEHFKDYTFGYGGFQGAKETTCVEIIRDSLKMGNIELISDLEYMLMLKSALDGEARSLILLPDDIIISPKVMIVDYFEK